MTPLFDFSDEARRLPVEFCVWYSKPCNKVGTKWSILLANEEGPKKIKLCDEHDKEFKKLKGMRGEPLDLAMVLKVFGIDPETFSLDEVTEIEERPAEEEVPAPSLDHSRTEQRALEAATPEENPNPLDLTPILEELRERFGEADVPEISARPSENHFLCGHVGENGKMCGTWIDTTKKSAISNEASRHGIQTYEIILYPTLKERCDDEEHMRAGCVRSFHTVESLRQHEIHTKLKPPAQKVQTPQIPAQQSLLEDADRATT